jgi:hypothetical protein
VGGAYVTHGDVRNAFKISVGREDLVDLHVDGTIVGLLKWILRK